MLEILKYIFSEWYIFVGVIVLIVVIGKVISDIVFSFKNNNTEERMDTGLFDKNGTPIDIGDKTRLVLDNGEIREFDVCFKTVNRIVKCHPDFYDEYSNVAITGIVFCWNGYDLFPCVDKNGVMDTSKMEVI